VEARVAAVHAAADRVDVREVALDQLDAGLAQAGGLVGVAHEGDDVVAALAQLRGQPPPDEAGPARHEGPHRGQLIAPRLNV
jgi:hypothetical protein